jgi:tRNA modification GTPase
LALYQLRPTPWLELQVHGGQEVVRWLFETFEAYGIRAQSSQDFVLRTTQDRLQALACAAFAEARTARTAAILLDQFHGAFSRALDTIHNAVTHDRFTEAAAALAEVMRFASLDRHLTAPWQVVIAGAPNVGKSSLVNALAGFQRSIVASTPGTTRDVVRTCLAIDGWPVEVADTAGLRAAAEHLEGAGVGLARDAVAGADLCLWVYDAGSDPIGPDVSAARLLSVLNKIDLAATWDTARLAGAIHVSAKTGEGLSELSEAISRALVPDVPPAGAAVPFTVEIGDRLREVQQALTEGNATTASHLLTDLRGGSLEGPQRLKDADDFPG